MYLASEVGIHGLISFYARVESNWYPSLPAFRMPIVDRTIVRVLLLNIDGARHRLTVMLDSEMFGTSDADLAAVAPLSTQP